MDWLRLWHDMPTDPKWRVIALRAAANISEVIAVYLFVLVNASRNEAKRGETRGIVSEDIAAALNVSPEVVEKILAAMQGKVLTGNQVTGWETRQPRREDSSTSRVREFRERLKQVAKRDVTQGNAREEEIREEKNKNTCVDEAFNEFEQLARSVGMLGREGPDGDWHRARTAWWPRMSFEDQLRLLTLFRERIASGNYDDPRFVPGVVSFFESKWKSPVRPRPREATEKKASNFKQDFADEAPAACRDCGSVAACGCAEAKVTETLEALRTHGKARAAKA